MRTSMRLLVALAFVMAVGAATSASAWTYASDNEDFHCNVTTANDLHVTYYSDTKMRLMSHFDDMFPIFVAVPTGPDSTQWSCTWSGATLVFCQMAHVGVEFIQQSANTIWKKDIFWTLNGVPQNPQPPYGPINGPGFTVTPPEGRTSLVVWRFTNNGTSPMILQNIQFRTAPLRTALPDMRYNMLPGWEAPRAPISVGVGGSIALQVQVPAMSQTTYVMAQGQVLINGEIEGHFVMQHEHLVGVPTVTPWGLAVLALVLLSLAVVVVRRTRREAA